MGLELVHSPGVHLLLDQPGGIDLAHGQEGVIVAVGQLDRVLGRGTEHGRVSLGHQLEGKAALLLGVQACVEPGVVREQQRLACGRLAFPEYRRLVRYRSVPMALVPYLDTWDPSFKNWGGAAQPYDERFFALHRGGDTDSNVITPEAPRYRGHVFILIGAANSSATFEFASRAKRAGIATLVGQATGGNRRGINGGAFFFLRLPNTGLEMDLPLIGQFPAGAEPDSGLEPDVHVAATLADIASGRDIELEAVRTLLERAPAR